MSARIVTAIALAVVTAGAIWFAPVWVFAVCAAVLMCAALAEWNRLLPCTFGAKFFAKFRAKVFASVSANFCIAVTALCMLAFCALLFSYPRALLLVCAAVVLWWCMRAVQLARAHTPPLTPSAHLLQGAFILAGAWCALLWMRVDTGGGGVIAMLLVICASDIFAFFTGRRFGKRKLAPRISPGKTIAGVTGGFGGALLAALLGALFLQLQFGESVLWVTAAVVAAAFGVAGDLHESALKRRAGVKDSGGLLPGHGGILDRIDAILSAAPAFALVWSAPQWAL